MWLQYWFLNKNWKIVLVIEKGLDNYVPASAVIHKVQANFLSWKAFKIFKLIKKRKFIGRIRIFFVVVVYLFCFLNKLSLRKKLGLDTLLFFYLIFEFLL